MTAEELKKQYNYYRRKIAQLEENIKNERNKEIEIVAGKVKGSSDSFPYTERRFSVQMYEPTAYDTSVKNIAKHRAEIQRIQKKLDAMNNFINEIADEQTKDIFTHYIVDNLSQQEIAELVCLDRSSVSKKMTGYLNFHTIHINSML